MERNINELVAQMTLEEKAGLCSGADFWHSKGVERLGIPGVMVSDGPHGLRKQEQRGGRVWVIGRSASRRRCFPAAMRDWRPAGTKRCWLRMGRALGEECRGGGRRHGALGAGR